LAEIEAGAEPNLAEHRLAVQRPHDPGSTTAAVAGVAEQTPAHRLARLPEFGAGAPYRRSVMFVMLPPAA
jgi:hypothetical protein